MVKQGAALVTGASGQDAHYLAELLRAAGNVVIGTTHRAAPTVHATAGFDEIVPVDLRSDGQIRAVSSDFVQRASSTWPRSPRAPRCTTTRVGSAK